jgi:hypothetical protein
VEHKATLEIIMRIQSRSPMFERSSLRKLSSRSLPRGIRVALRHRESMRGWVTDDMGTHPANAGNHAANEATSDDRSFETGTF